MSRLRWLRWTDAVLAWLALVLGLTVLLPRMPAPPAMALAICLLFVVSLIPRLRQAWRPLSAITTLAISHGLPPGDLAWFVHWRDADLVLLTPRHGIRIVIA